MSLLFMGAGLLFGCVMFFAFAACFLCRPYSEKVKEEWLDSLTKEERKAYWHHEKRKKAYLKMRMKQSIICQRIRQKAYDEGRPDMGWYEAWGEAAEQVGANDFADVFNAPDCPPAAGGNEYPVKWREKPARPPGV